jgi:hypothetical protein
VIIGPHSIEIEFPLVQNMMPLLVRKQLNLERKIHAIIQLSKKLLDIHKERLIKKEKRIVKKNKVSFNL